jgi:3-deoxy-D-manno-octulosonic-acid transferase
MNIFLYNVFLWLYKTHIRIVSPWNPKARLWISGRKNILETIQDLNINKHKQVIWMHCASLGEFEQGRPIIEKIRTLYLSSKIFITFFSPSGFEVRKDYEGADYVFYLPPDSKKNARQFIEAVNPSLVLWIKYDYWFHYLNELKNRNIPTLLISAIYRPDQPFFKWYGSLHRYMLNCFNHLFVQTEESKKLLRGVVIPEKITVSGDTRFDRVIEIAELHENLPVIEKFCGDRVVVVAGSTWEEDEEELDHYANTHPEIRFIIAPHEIEESHLRNIEKLFQKSMRLSVLQNNAVPISQAGLRQTSGVNTLIIDNFGMLARLYKYASIAYLGGGFGDDGVYNVLEAAVYGKPVVFGPVIEKYLEAMSLVETGGGIVIDSALEAEDVFNRLLSDPEEYRLCCEASRNYVYARKGATRKILEFIQENRLLTS